MSLSKVLRSSVLYLSKEKYIFASKCLSSQPTAWLNTISQRPDRSRARLSTVLAVAVAVFGVNLYLHLENSQNDFPHGSQNHKFARNQLLAREASEYKNDFASIEFEGIPYMTPQDFIESVTEDHPRPRMRRKILSKENYQTYLKQTPPLNKGSNKFLRNLEERGLISYSDYLFLLCVLTKPKTSFEIAFNMFDQDGNQRVDKKEFLVVTKIFQRNSEESVDNSSNDDALIETDQKAQSIIVNESNGQLSNLPDRKMQIDPVKHMDTSLLVHLFGKAGTNVLTFEQFKKFMEDLQIEILEIEFNEFSKGMSKISSMDLAEIMLRYTNFDQNKRMSLLRRLPSKMDAYIREISFEKFLQFNTFMNNLADFALSLKFHTMANRPISTAEFQRAVKISSGFELDPQIVQVIFAIFDQDGDGQLSYKEFIAVLKDRLRRGQKVTKRRSFENHYGGDLGQNNTDINETHVPWYAEQSKQDDGDLTYLKRFKNCVMNKTREGRYK